jgi:hypothetical protein
MSGTSIKTEIKDPNARLDYTWDWTEWLLGSDTITDATFTIVTDDGSLVLGPPVIGTGTVVVMISGGTLGKTYLVTGHIVTSEGREDDRSRRLAIRQR